MRRQNKNQPKKLALHTETLRKLDAAQLQAVAGGIPGFPGCTANITGCSTNLN